MCFIYLQNRPHLPCLFLGKAPCSSIRGKTLVAVTGRASDFVGWVAAAALVRAACSADQSVECGPPNREEAKGKRALP